MLFIANVIFVIIWFLVCWCLFCCSMIVCVFGDGIRFHFPMFVVMYVVWLLSD